MKKMDINRKVLIFLSVVFAIALVVVGIGYIPVTRSYSCYTTQYYDCYVTGYYDCYQTQEYPCQEAYTCYHNEPYTYTGTVHLTYTYEGYSSNTDWSGDANIWANVRNTDSVGGYFTVVFEATIEGMTGTKTATQWISAGDLGTVSVQFPRSWFQAWSYEVPIVTAPTKSVQLIGTHSVAGTCYQDSTCTRQVLVTNGCSQQVWTTNGCSQQVADTCYTQDRLFW